MGTYRTANSSPGCCAKPQQAARGGRGAAGVDLPPHVSGDRDHGVSRRTGGRSSTRSGSPRTRRRSRRSSYDRMADTNAPRRSGSPTAASVAAIRGSALSERIRFRGVLQVGRGRVLAAEGECEGRIPRAETLSGPIRPDPPSRRVQCRSKRSAQWRRPGRRRRRRTRTNSSTSRSPRARRGLPRGHGQRTSRHSSCGCLLCSGGRRRRSGRSDGELVFGRCRGSFPADDTLRRTTPEPGRCSGRTRSRGE